MTSRNFVRRHPFRAAGALALGWGVALAAQAQSMTAAQLREAALAALGGERSGLAFAGAGYDACLGQAWAVDEGWARWELSDYRRVIDYEAGASRHTAQRRAGLDPQKIGGCGAQPDARAAPQQGFVDAASPWADQLAIWLTPHGFLRLLGAAEVQVERDGEFWRATLPLERGGVTYTLIGRFDADYELRSITTWVDDSVFGDMEVLAEFGDYRDFGALSFPRTLSVKQGGSPTFYLEIDGAEPSAEAVRNEAPRRGGGAPAAAPEPAFSEIGPGVFAFHGGYQAVAVEFEDYAVVVDGLQSDARVRELIALVKQAIPGKPIRYVVSTHSHFDHASGLRQFAAEGATILTHARNVAFFERALATPRTLRASGTEPDRVNARVQGVDGSLELIDGAGQALRLYALPPNAHAADMLIAYLPGTGTIVEADLLQPWINPVFAGEGGGPHPFLVQLAADLDALGIDYENFVPIHVPPDPPTMDRSALAEALGTP